MVPVRQPKRGLTKSLNPVGFVSKIKMLSHKNGKMQYVTMRVPREDLVSHQSLYGLVDIGHRLKL